jgi:hypothetical protein
VLDVSPAGKEVDLGCHSSIAYSWQFCLCLMSVSGLERVTLIMAKVYIPAAVCS